MMHEKKTMRRRLRSSYLSVIISMSLVLFVVGFIGFLLINAKQFSDFVKENIALSVIFSNTAKEGEIEAFKAKINLADFTRDQKYISKEEALIEARDINGMTPDDPFYNVQIFPSSLHIFLKSEYVNPQRVDSIAQVLIQSKLVKEINYPKNELRKIYFNIGKVTLGAFIVSAIFLIISVVLINNAIRLNINSKRFDIKTMQLVGATKTFIQKPFLRKALLTGLLSASIAIMALWMIIYYVFIAKAYITKPFTVDYYLLYLLAFTLIAIGVFISLFSTYLATRRFLNSRVDQLYY